jgi:hypothetical protein
LLQDFDACLGGLFTARNNNARRGLRLHGGLSGKWEEGKRSYQRGE